MQNVATLTKYTKYITQLVMPAATAAFTVAASEQYEHSVRAVVLPNLM